MIHLLILLSQMYALADNFDNLPLLAVKRRVVSLERQVKLVTMKQVSNLPVMVSLFLRISSMLFSLLIQASQLNTLSATASSFVSFVVTFLRIVPFHHIQQSSSTCALDRGKPISLCTYLE